MAEKKGPIELNKNDPESLYNWIAYKVSCPEFRNPIKNFIDENCSTFVDIDENSFEQGQLFNEMNLLLENLLKDVLDEGQITQEDFLKAAERGITDKKHKKYFNQIINFGDYTFFKSVMTKRNYQIIQMAEKQMNQEKEMENKNMEGMDGEGKAGLPPEIVAQMLENEQTEINEAIKQSLADEDEKRRIAIKPVNKEKDLEIEIIKSEKTYNYKTNGDKIIKKANEKEREDRGYRVQKKYEKVEEIKEEPSSRYKKGRYTNTTTNVEKNEDMPTKKYNRYSKKEEPKEEDAYQNEIIIKEEKRVRPKRFVYSKEEKPQVYEHKTEIIESSGGDNKPDEIRKTEVVIEKTTVVDKSTDLENKKRGLRKRYGKH